LINESIQHVGHGSELVNQSGTTLQEIVSSVKRVTDIIAEISAASQEQAIGIDQVNKAIIAMDQTTQQNVGVVEETASAAQAMRDQADELQRQVQVFKIPGTSESLHVKRDASGSETNDASRTTRHASTKFVAREAGRPTTPKKPVAATRLVPKEPVGAAVGNDQGHHGLDEGFEEF
jgi:methyl-accepting chemotaxis protein